MHTPVVPVLVLAWGLAFTATGPELPDMAGAAATSMIARPLIKVATTVEKSRIVIYLYGSRERYDILCKVRE